MIPLGISHMVLLFIICMKFESFSSMSLSCSISEICLSISFRISPGFVIVQPSSPSNSAIGMYGDRVNIPNSMRTAGVLFSVCFNLVYTPQYFSIGNFSRVALVFTSMIFYITPQFSGATAVTAHVYLPPASTFSRYRFSTVCFPYGPRFRHCN